MATAEKLKAAPPPDDPTAEPCAELAETLRQIEELQAQLVLNQKRARRSRRRQPGKCPRLTRNSRACSQSSSRCAVKSSIFSRIGRFCRAGAASKASRSLAMSFSVAPEAT